MTWDEVLEYQHIVKDVARIWAKRYRDDSSRDDFEQHMYLYLRKRVSLTNASNPEAYVRAACWRACHKFVTTHSTQPIMAQAVSLEHLEDNCAYQIDDDGNARPPIGSRADNSDWVAED